MLHRNSPFGLRFHGVLWIVMAILSTSCHDVEYGEYTPYLAAAKEDIYQFDISLLSEWGGAIEPESKEAVFCLKDQAYFRMGNLGYLPVPYSYESDDDLATVTLNLASTDAGDETVIQPISCRKISPNNAEHYDISNACLSDASLYGSVQEDLYLCLLNFNLLNLSSINMHWHNIFPQLADTVDPFKMTNVPVCIHKQEDQLLIRPNEAIAVLPLTEHAPVQISEDKQTIRVRLLEPNPDAQNDDSYYEVLCSAASAAQDKSICQFDGETAYDCQTYIGGGTGLRHVWEDLFKRQDVPMYVVSNGDNFGMTKAYSREFNDLPTLQLLSALQLSADTFGNHAFDKDIASLSLMVEQSHYPYVISNLKNVPQNLRGISPFTIWQVPAQNATCSSENAATCCKTLQNPDGEDCLSVAVVSALESTVKDYVYPGLFGSLDVTDYCDVLYAMQEAYNANARAFFVLAHLSTESDYRVKETELADGKLMFNYAESGGKYILTSDRRINIFTLLQTLFSLQGYYPDLCPETHLIIPEYRMQSKQAECPLICASDETLCADQCNHAYDKNGLKDMTALERQIIREMNQEIFQGIIGIFTASGDEHLVGFTTESLSEDVPEGIVPFRMNATHFGDVLSDYPDEPYFFDNDYLYTKNLFQTTSQQFSPLTHTALASVFGVSAHAVSESRFETIYDQLKTHPLWVMRVPGGGEHTAHFRITLKRQDTADSRPDTLSQPYVASLDYAEILPTAHSPEEMERVTPSTCLQHLKKLVQTDHAITSSISDVAAACQTTAKNINHKDPLGKACSCYHYFNHIQRSAMMPDVDDPEYTACSDYLQTRAQPHTQDSLSVSELQHLWMCIYKAKTSDICMDNEPWDMSESESFEFKDRIMLDLTLLDGDGNKFTEYIRTLEENDLRSQTTFIGNLVANMILSFFNLGKATDHYDVSLINAGALNLLSDVRLTRHTRETLKLLSPFENSFLSIELSPSSFVNYITHGIGTRDDNRGQYPLLSGVMMSTVRLDGAHQVTELWSKHHPDEFMPYGCQSEDGDTCQCALKQPDGTCLTRQPENLLNEPLYQLLDIVDVTDNAESYATDDSGKIDCVQVFKNQSNFEDLYQDTNNANHLAGVYAFDPRTFHWQGSARFESYLSENSANAQKYKLNASYCSAENNNRLFNLYYSKHGDIDKNQFYPMILHVNQETLHSSATPRQVCKCYFTLADAELEPGQTEAGFTTDPTASSLNEAPDNAIADIYDTHNYAEPAEGRLISKKLRIVLIDFIAKGGDNFELPTFVDPASNDSSKSDVMFDAYPPTDTTHDILGQFFDTQISSTCDSLEKNPVSIDNRSDLDIAWDNAFYHHINVTQTNDKTNVFIMERPKREAPLALYGQYILDGIQHRLTTEQPEQ